MKASKFTYLTTPDPIWKPYSHDRVEFVARTNTGDVAACLLGRCYSEYATGPNLCTLADAVAELIPAVEYVGCESCRYLGWHTERSRQ